MAGRFGGITPAEEPARGLRDLGSGANDRSGAHGFVINAQPDPVKTREAQVATNPMYPRMDTSDPKYRVSVKGCIAFVDKRWTHLPTSEYREDIDMIVYLDNLAGQYDDSTEPWQLVDNLAYVGIVKNDVLSLDIRAGSENTLGWSDASTIRQTGPYRIRAGFKVYWDVPPKRTNPKEPAHRGASEMKDLPANSEPLMTMAYDPVIHKGSPTLFWRALHTPPQGGSTSPMSFSPGTSDFGVRLIAEEWLTSAIGVGLIVMLCAMEDADNNRYRNPETFEHRALLSLLAAIENGKTPFQQDGVGPLPGPSTLRKKIMDRLLNPMGSDANASLENTNLFGNRHMEDIPLFNPMSKQKLGQDLQPKDFPVTGSVMLPPSYQARQKFDLYEGGFGFAQSEGFPVSGAQAGAAIFPHMGAGGAEGPDARPMRRLNRVQLHAAEDFFYFTARGIDWYTGRVFCQANTSADSGFDMDKVSVRVINSS
jgi:hypothetical protein